jgi:hypothetical protein
VTATAKSQGRFGVDPCEIKGEVVIAA